MKIKTKKKKVMFNTRERMKKHIYNLDFSKVDESYIKDKIEKAELKIERSRNTIKIWENRLRRLKI